MDHVYEVITNKQAEIIRVQHEIHQLREWIRDVETKQAAKEQIEQMGRRAEKQAREKNATTVVMALVGLLVGAILILSIFSREPDPAQAGGQETLPPKIAAAWEQ
jgi:hypothetical protein